jgi:transcriptional regulator GlxA family with amidase domain
MAADRIVLFVVFDGMKLLDAAGPAEVFAEANRFGASYRVLMASVDGRDVVTSVGTRLAVSTSIGAVKTVDTAVIAGGDDLVGHPIDPELVAAVKDLRPRTRRMASICTGSFILAQTGLLDGRRATTHWMYTREMAARFPAVRVEEDRIFIADGPVWTSAGMTAGIDLALALVEGDRGAEVARQIARVLVMYHRRAGGQSQFSTLLEIAPRSDRIQRALSHAKQNLRSTLSVEELAAAAALSPRQFSRLFHAETGRTPAKAVESLRVEAARLMMEEGRHPIEVIAVETGFADRERMRRAFLRAFGQPPQSIRRGARAAGPAALAGTS